MLRNDAERAGIFLCPPYRGKKRLAAIQCHRVPLNPAQKLHQFLSSRLPRSGMAFSSKFSHSPGFRGKGCRRSSKASRREKLEVEEPVTCRDGASFDFHATLVSMLGPTLIRDQGIQVCEPCEKRLLAAPGMVEAFHHE